MSFVVFRGLAALLAAVSFPLLCQTASAADFKRPLASTVMTPAPVPTGSELVGKLLAEENGPSDPDVPMPQRGLTRTQDRPSTKPQIYGRQEDGGAVLGLKFPIPATRGLN
jgi:hypothetical protein